MTSELPGSLSEVDRVEIVTLMDNYVDVLLPSTDIVKRPPIAKNNTIPTTTLMAEHGLSLLITVFKDTLKHTILFDTGYTKIGVAHNLNFLDIDIASIDAIALSHGHMDHTGSLNGILDQLHKKIPLIVHPDAFISPRYLQQDDGTRYLFPLTLVKSDLKSHNIDLLEHKMPTALVKNMILSTGEVERTTPFEQGMPNAFLERGGKIVKDAILDDQSLIILLKGKGLVIITGCCHAGVINTIRYAEKITSTQKIYALLGGFHLTGPAFEPVIKDIIEELKKVDPRVLVPMHCTGWKAIQQFSDAFPTSFILNSVGSKYILS
jgi:7,8-dihydropterin-6-yl-methyl-4-(beta-D-ribofuranosyl)aminobenzene 5'-phosphate synthase